MIKEYFKVKLFGLIFALSVFLILIWIRNVLSLKNDQRQFDESFTKISVQNDSNDSIVLYISNKKVDTENFFIDDENLIIASHENYNRLMNMDECDRIYVYISKFFTESYCEFIEFEKTNLSSVNNFVWNGDYLN